MTAELSQPRAAILRANQVRRQIAAVRQRLRDQADIDSGRLAAAGILETLPDDATRVRLGVLLHAIPFYGTDRVRRLLIAAQIRDPHRHLGELTVRQRRTLAGILRAQTAERLGTS